MALEAVRLGAGGVTSSPLSTHRPQPPSRTRILAFKANSKFSGLPRPFRASLVRADAEPLRPNRPQPAVVPQRRFEPAAEELLHSSPFNVRAWACHAARKRHQPGVEDAPFFFLALRPLSVCLTIDCTVAEAIFARSVSSLIVRIWRNSAARPAVRSRKIFCRLPLLAVGAPAQSLRRDSDNDSHPPPAAFPRKSPRRPTGSFPRRRVL
jgi:hypothetical protein